MKVLIPILFIILFNFGFAQSQNNTVLFAQCYFEIQDEQEMLTLEENLRLHPNTTIVRLDFISQRAFILTEGINSLSKDEFKSWFENYANTLNCIQIGIYGVDEISPYPFTNCQD